MGCVYLHERLLNHIPEVVYVGRERVDGNGDVPFELWRSPVPAADDAFQGLLILGAVPARQTEIGDVVPGRSHSAGIVFCVTFEISRPQVGNGMVHLREHIPRIHHDIR